jgi:hypothetical protein
VTRLDLLTQPELEPRRHRAVAVAELDEHLRLVDRHPVMHTVGELVDDRRGVIAEPLGHVAVEPPAAPM